VLNAEPELVPVDFLTQILAQSKHIRGLVQQAAAAEDAAARGQLLEAGAGLTALDALLQGEIQERTLLDHQLAAAFEQEEGSRKASLHDRLTGLPNRVLLHDRLEHGIAQATRHRWLLAVMFVDLNEFKHINDTHGHQAGDAVLQSIATRLAHTTRHEDTVSRYGGDEFVCLLTPLHEQKHIATIATKLLAAIQAPCEVCGRESLVKLSVRGSIGIAVFPKDGASAADLIRRADEAMYVAKANQSGFAFAQ
jgi:diguanylate cyclase (GGDEF)-like protein